jgi:clan AA aspartic protease (TIGR02281 family)
MTLDRIKPFFGWFALTLVMWLAAVPPARSDRILLKNGNTVEGIVSRETPATVTLRLGGGDASFRRSQIRSVELDSPASNTVMETAWRNKYFLNRGYVPAGCADLAACFRALGDRRREAIGAHAALLEAGDTIHAIKQDMAHIQDEFDTTNAELKEASPTNDVAAYNDLVAKNNRLHASLALRNTDLETELAARPIRMKIISAYLAALQSCSNAVTAARESLSDAAEPGETARCFVDQMDGQVRAYASDFQHIVVNTTLHGNSTVIAVLVNGRAWGNFIVDTGAEIVTLSRAFADRAGVNVAEGRPAGMVMANGTRISATAVRLASVKVGGIDTPGAVAAVLPYPPAPDVDGLLGMNVLNSFLVSMDSSTGRLELEHFAPR